MTTLGKPPGDLQTLLRIALGLGWRLTIHVTEENPLVLIRVAGGARVTAFASWDALREHIHRAAPATQA